ncbi:helix-turn-helix domain-containing protein [bacterium]|nr:helix-turn-helix domain-containing protein [bacterium]MBU1025402.1 helix-turn-helix domain-containing protein [bacterium]
MKSKWQNSDVSKLYRNRVRECRLSALIPSQEELATRTGINRATICALENNRLFLSSRNALIISGVLGCSLDDLYQRRNAA